MIRFFCLAILFAFAAYTLFLAQTNDKSKQKPSALPLASEAFSFGGNVSWLPQIEATGYKFL